MKRAVSEGTFRALARDSKDEEAAKYYNAMPAYERAFVAVKMFGGENAILVHPLGRAQKAASTISDFRGQVRDGSLRGARGAIIDLSPGDRRHIDGALAEFAQAQMRNGLIATGVKGWAQKQPIDEAPIVERIKHANPEAYQQLAGQLRLVNAPTILWPDEVARLSSQWTQVRPIAERQGNPAAISALLRTNRAKKGNKLDRYQEAQRQVGGAYAAPAPQTNALLRQ